MGEHLAVLAAIVAAAVVVTRQFLVRPPRAARGRDAAEPTCAGGCPGCASAARCAGDAAFAEGAPPAPRARRD